MSISQKRKRRRVELSPDSDSDSEGSGETHFLLSPSDRKVEAPITDENIPIAVHTRPSGVVQPLSLSVSATAGQYKLDFEAAISANAELENYGHKSNWDEIAKEYRAKVAHARLIHDMYGAQSPVTCDRCVSNETECRIYHPDLKVPGANAGSCGECRLQSRSCTVGGVGQRYHKWKAPRMDKPAKAPQESAEMESAPRPHGAETVKFMFYCPVPTCSRHWEGFSHRPNFLRHVEYAHPEVDESRMEEGRRTSVPTHRVASEIVPAAPSSRARGCLGTYLCPVANCTSRSAGGFTRVDNFRRHVRGKHPNSIHAQILEAVISKSRITLPPPLDRSEYTADFEAAQSTNAPPGSFGHRPSTQWTRAHPNVRTRITHARMIHGKYGVIAPESCLACRKRGTVCMLYHPGLENVGRALGTYCGECRDRSVKCEIGPQPFAMILEGGRDRSTAADMDGYIDGYDDVEAGANPQDNASVHGVENGDANAFTNAGVYSGAPSPYEGHLNHPAPSQSQHLQSSCALNSEESDVKNETQDNEDTVRGIEIQVQAQVGTGAGAEDEPHSDRRTITAEDLATVVAASDGALQIGGDLGDDADDGCVQPEGYFDLYTEYTDQPSEEQV